MDGSAFGMGRKTAWWISGLFWALLVAPLVVQLVRPPTDISDLENRPLASAPALSEAWREWPSYPGHVNAWLTDRFGFRDQLIRFYALFREELLIQREWSAVRGDDGWLFLAMDDAMRSHQGLTPFAPGEAEAWLDRVQELEARATAAGALFLVMVAPNKHTIYSEHLSEWPRLLPGETRLESLERVSLDRGPPFLSLRDALLAEKARGQVFFQTDTHWTDAGGYAGYRALMDRLAAMGGATDVIGRDALESYEQTREGDLNRVIGDLSAPPETVIAPAVASPSPRRGYERLEGYDFNEFDGTRATMDARGRPSVLILHDSFIGEMRPFLRESFDNITYVHHRFGTVPVDAIETGDYDVVILELAERFLMKDFAPVALSQLPQNVDGS